MQDNLDSDLDRLVSSTQSSPASKPTTRPPLHSFWQTRPRVPNRSDTSAVQSTPCLPSQLSRTDTVSAPSSDQSHFPTDAQTIQSVETRTGSTPLSNQKTSDPPFSEETNQPLHSPFPYQSPSATSDEKTTTITTTNAQSTTQSIITNAQSTTHGPTRDRAPSKDTRAHHLFRLDDTRSFHPHPAHTTGLAVLSSPPPHRHTTRSDIVLRDRLDAFTAEMEERETVLGSMARDGRMEGVLHLLRRGEGGGGGSVVSEPPSARRRPQAIIHRWSAPRK